jgi:hypothetical protein
MYQRALLVAACAAAFTIAGLGTGSAKTISTYSNWNGSDYVYPFGCSDTTTYGQLVTVPKKTMLNKFSFWWANVPGGNSGEMVVRAEVYAWDGQKATGSALWESKPTHISYGDSSFHKATFKPGALPLTKGAQYVLFASIAKDYEECTNDYELIWGTVDDTSYSGGTFVYQNNGGDESQWTTVPWTTTYGRDTTFSASFH